MADSIRDLFSVDDSLDPKMVGALLKALDNSDGSAFDYLKFREATQKLAQRGMAMPDAQESVFTTAETIGTSRKSLLTSARGHLETLDKQREAFESAREKKLTEGMATDRTRLEKLAGQLQKLEEQRRALDEKEAQLKEKQAEIEAHLATTQQRVQEQGAKFEEAYRALRQQVEQDVTEMQAHVG